MTILQSTELTCDLLVAGGGMAGISAAIAAARCGARVMLVHDRPVLGGNASSEIRMHVVGADQSGGRGAPLATEARETGIIEEIRLENCVRNPQRSSSMFDLILYEKCRAEPNLTLLFNTTVTSAEVKGQRIVSVGVERQSTEESFTIRAKVFVDATGDGRLGVEAGSPFREGRESRDDFGESLAPEAADALRLGSSLMMQARKHDRPMPFKAPPWARKFSEQDLRLRPHADPGGGHGDLGLEYGFWWVEWGGHLDTIRENERVRDELLAIVLGVWDHIKNDGDHGAENWALEWFGWLPGKRESRRFVGQYMLTQHDVVSSISHDDAIAFGGWFIDTHPPHGVDAVDEAPCTQHEVPWLYDIPLRCSLSPTVDNLMFAGRNISATHIAFASTRVMATCSLVGQGVGTAAAHAIATDLLPSQLATDVTAMESIRRQLIGDDCFLLGELPRDDRDLAHRAFVTASSEQAGGMPTNVVTPHTRSVHGPMGAPPGRSIPGTHRWMSKAGEGLPAWLELTWPAPITAQQIELVFDTGLHRVLTFSLADSYVAKMQWGRPQEETVTDFTLGLRRDGAWQEIVRIEGNYQRLRRFPTGEAPFDAARLTVTATGGIDHARVCRVRVV